MFPYQVEFGIPIIFTLPIFGPVLKTKGRSREREGARLRAAAKARAGVSEATKTSNTIETTKLIAYSQNDKN